jgi:hypothetical protein
MCCLRQADHVLEVLLKHTGFSKPAELLPLVRGIINHHAASEAGPGCSAQDRPKHASTQLDGSGLEHPCWGRTGVRHGGAPLGARCAMRPETQQNAGVVQPPSEPSGKDGSKEIHVPSGPRRPQTGWQVDGFRFVCTYVYMYVCL